MIDGKAQQGRSKSDYLSFLKLCIEQSMTRIRNASTKRKKKGEKEEEETMMMTTTTSTT